MAKYDEFDLDVQTVKNNASGNGAKSGWGCVTDTITVSIQYCPSRECSITCATECTCPPQSDHCTDTYSICHSYCGGTCKR